MIAAPAPIAVLCLVLAATAAGGETRWLADFEDARDLERWQARGVAARLATAGASHGERAAELRFAPGGAPAFLLEVVEARDWRGHARLAFDLTNAGDGHERLVLEIRDAAGTAYKEEFHLAPGGREAAAIRISDLAAYLDVARIESIRLFRWRPATAATFLLDAVRLEPGAAVAAAPPPGPAPLTLRPGERWQAAWASSLVKLFPDTRTFPGAATGAIEITLARGEHESFQVVVLGARRGTARVAIAVEPPRLPAEGSAFAAAAFAAAAIDIRAVESVTTTRPYYPVTRVGAWPDPLPPARRVTAGPGELRAFWVTVFAERGLPAGTYRGRVRLVDEGGRHEEIPLLVRLHDFDLPRTPRLRTAFDLYPGRLRQAYAGFVPNGERWLERLDELEDRYHEELLRHRVSPMLNLDPDAPGARDRLARFTRQGLTAFAVGKHGGGHGNDWPAAASDLERLVSRYRRGSVQLGEAGLLERAYVYTWDEPPAALPRVAEVAGAIAVAAPGLRNLVAVQWQPDLERDRAWLADIDIVVTRISAYDPGASRRLRQAGKETWVYVSSPTHPYPSFNIDYPALAHRIVPWMAWKYDIEGLLYWCVNFWRRDPWQDPRNFADDQNGNGSLLYPGPDGPVPSLRLAVLRDGIEDHDYLGVLAGRVAAAEGRGETGSALAAARELLVVPDDLVRTLRSYGDSEAALLARRAAIGLAIESLPPPRP